MIMQASGIITFLSLIPGLFCLEAPPYDAEFNTAVIRVLPEVKASITRVLNTLTRIQSDWQQCLNRESVPVIMLLPPPYDEIVESDFSTLGLDLIINFNKSIYDQKPPYFKQHSKLLVSKGSGYTGCAGYLADTKGLNIMVLGDTYLSYNLYVHDSTPSVAGAVLRKYLEDSDHFDPVIAVFEIADPGSEQSWWYDFVDRFISYAAATSDIPEGMSSRTTTQTRRHGQFIINMYKDLGFGVASGDVSNITFIKLHNELEYNKYIKTQFDIKKPSYPFHLEPASGYVGDPEGAKAWMYPRTKDDMEQPWSGLWVDCGTEDDTKDVPLAVVSSEGQGGTFNTPWQLNLDHEASGSETCSVTNPLQKVIVYQDSESGVIKKLKGVCKNGDVSDNTCGSDGGLEAKEIGCSKGSIRGITTITGVDLSTARLWGIRLLCSPQ